MAWDNVTYGGKYYQQRIGDLQVGQVNSSLKADKGEKIADHSWACGVQPARIMAAKGHRRPERANIDATASAKLP
jgi:hypothetical protein